MKKKFISMDLKNGNLPLKAAVCATQAPGSMGLTGSVRGIVK